MTIAEIDAALTEINDRASAYMLEEQIAEMLGSDWVEQHPSFQGIYGVVRLTDILLEQRFELAPTMEGDENGDIQEELDALTGSDINIG